jgi:hypothetical protein
VLLLDVFAVLARESVGEVRALPRLGLGLADGSSMDNSLMTGNFEGRRGAGRQGPHEKDESANVVAVEVALLELSNDLDLGLWVW